MHWKLDYHQDRPEAVKPSCLESGTATTWIDREDRMKLAGLYMLRPYDPNRIPVVLIHGLQSSPLIWRNMVAEIQKSTAATARR